MNWSELARDPKKVADMADEDGGVRVVRRDGVNLILTREDRVVRAGAGAVIAARAMRQMLAEKSLVEAGRALVKEFPWIKQLPEDDLDAFVEDFVDAMMAAAELGHWVLVDQVVNEWKASALIYADSALVDRLSAPITDDHGPVPSPAHDEPDDAEER